MGGVNALKTRCTLLLCALVVGVGNAWGDAETVYSTGFESSEGFTSSTTYNKTESNGPSGKKWTIYYGTVSTNDALNGSQSVQCRYYGTQNTVEPYAQMDFDVTNVKSISFYSKVSNTNLSLQLQYSDDEGLSWNDAQSYTITTSSTKYTYTYSSTFESVRFRFLVKHTNTISSSNQKFFLDDVVIYEPEVIKNLSSIAVNDEFTKVQYKVGDSFSSAGLSLTASYDDDSEETITTGYTMKIGETVLTDGDVLSSIGDKTVTITYGGKTTTTNIYVGALKSIAVTTPPTKTVYNETQTFDPTGMVVTATFSTSGSHADWTEDVDDYTYSPTTPLTPSNTSITISYTWNEVEETTTQAITVNAGEPYTVTFNAGTGSCATVSSKEDGVGAGVTLPTATIDVTGWSFVGWATASVTNTEDEPTTYAASATYNPTEDCTLYAVYKFTETSATTYKRATSVSDITSASSVVIVCNNQSKVLDNTLNSGVTAPTETSSKITAPEAAIFTLTGNNTDGYTLTNGTTTVGATSTNNSTQISNTTTNDLWVVKAHNTSNTFYFENKEKSNLCLEYYNNSGYKWMVYAPSSNVSSNAAIAMKVYVPISTTVYNSNPAAIVNPTIAWTTDGNKTLYLQNINTYDNVANVTGIAKTPVYTSSDETVATVSEAGVVNALKAGSTTIKATVEAEAGVNTKAEVSYVVTVKDASNISGIKAITNSSTVVTFTADLTDAVVTYVKDSHAFIQDASGAIYASCGSNLTAGKKINGAVSGSVKAANQIDEITAIDLTEATITEDGVIPSASVISAATLASNKADYEGKLVSIEEATVTASLTSGNASGGKISDDGKTTEINLYAPDSNINALKDAEGTFNGYITLYGGSTVRFNLFEQSQITLTKNAPTDQPLSFAEDAVELDEDTDDFNGFAGQAVSGAKGTVTYSIISDDDEVVTSINATTGAVVLSGNCGTATIKAAAAANEVTEAGVTTPYTATEKSYTVSVYPRYIVTFVENGAETEVREITHGVGVAVPTPAAIIDHSFIGWSTTTVATTNTKPSLADITSTIYPSDNTQKYYAVYAFEKGTPIVEHTSTFTVKQASAPESPYVNDGSSWTWSNVTFQNDNNAKIDSSNGSITFTLPSGGTAKSLTITKTGNSWSGDAAVVLKDANSNTVNTFTSSSLSFTFTAGTYDQSASYTLTNTTSKNAWVDHITFEYTTGGITYEGYTTTVETNVFVTISAAKYATFSNSRAVDFSETGVTVYKAKVDTEKKVVKLTEVSDGIVPANTGVILYKDVDANTDVTVPVTTTDAAISENDLVATVTSTLVKKTEDDTNFNYIMQLSNENIVFNMAIDDGAYMPAGKAYLSTTVDASTTGARLSVIFDDETASIATVNVKKGESDHNAVYNLNGQRLAQPRKGLNIVNGKKMFVK